MILGTINKRVDIGYNKFSDSIFIHASSNSIEFTYDEIECLVSVLSCWLQFDGIKLLNTNKIALWEPATPPAEVTIP